MRLGNALATGCWMAVAILGSARGQEPEWSRAIILSGPERYQLNQVDPVLRPYRPFHFYGNALRRSYYRGNPLPTMEDLERGFSAILPPTEGPPPPPPLHF